MITDPNKFYLNWLPRCAKRKMIVASQQPTNGCIKVKLLVEFKHTTKHITHVRYVGCVPVK